MISPGPSPLKVDLWRPVRHPPPDFVHAMTVKSAQDVRDEVSPGHPATLPGKMLSLVFYPREYDPGQIDEWRIVLDVRQGSESLPGFPAEYSGPLPPGGEPLAQLRVSEIFERA